MGSKFGVGLCAALTLLVSGTVEAAGKQKTKSNNSNERCLHLCPIPRSEAATAPSPACDAGHRTYTGGRCLPDEAVATQVSPASSTCAIPQAKGGPIGGIIVKGDGCMKIAPPTAPSKGIKEGGIK